MYGPRGFYLSLYDLGIQNLFLFINSYVLFYKLEEANKVLCTLVAANQVFYNLEAASY